MFLCSLSQALYHCYMFYKNLHETMDAPILSSTVSLIPVHVPTLYQMLNAYLLNVGGLYESASFSWQWDMLSELCS